MNDHAGSTARLMRIRARLAPRDRQVLDEVLGDERLVQDLVARIADKSDADALAALRDLIAGSKPPRSLPGPSDRVLEVAALLTEDERDRVMRLPDGFRASLEHGLGAMPPEQGVEYVRRCLEVFALFGGKS